MLLGRQTDAEDVAAAGAGSSESDAQERINQAVAEAMRAQASSLEQRERALLEQTERCEAAERQAAAANAANADKDAELGRVRAFLQSQDTQTAAAAVAAAASTASGSNGAGSTAAKGGEKPARSRSPCAAALAGALPEKHARKTVK